jgi:tetratricopeptide (TPR) repeat protein
MSYECHLTYKFYYLYKNYTYSTQYSDNLLKEVVYEFKEVLYLNFPTNGQVLRQYRKTLGISQLELCIDRININTISRLENDIMHFTPVLALLISENINKIAAAKNMSLRVGAAELLLDEEKRCEIWCMNELKKAEALTDKSSSIGKCMEILEVASKYNNHNILNTVYELLAFNFYEIKRYEEALEYYSLVLESFKRSDNIRKCISITNSIAICHFRSSGDKAMEYYEKAYKLIESAQYEKGFSWLKLAVKYNKALCDIAAGNYENARKNLEASDDFCAENRDYSIQLLIVKGNLDIIDEKYKKAKDTFMSQLGNTGKEMAIYRHIMLNNTAICMYHLGELDESAEYFERAVKEQLPEASEGLTPLLINSAYAHIYSSNPDIALRYIEGALHNAMVNEQHAYAIDCYHIEYSIYKRKKNTDLCFDTLEKCKNYIKLNNLGNDFLYRNQLMIIDLFLFQNDIQKAEYLMEGMVSDRIYYYDNNGSIPPIRYNVLYPDPVYI